MAYRSHAAVIDHGEFHIAKRPPGRLNKSMHGWLSVKRLMDIEAKGWPGRKPLKKKPKPLV